MAVTSTTTWRGGAERPATALAGMALLALAWRAGDAGLCCLGAPLLLWGLAGSLGCAALRRWSLPAALALALCLPPPAAVHGAAVSLLKDLMARSACLLLRASGQNAKLEGYTLILPAGELHIIDACSGARTQGSLLLLAAALLALREHPPLVRLLTLLAALPVGWLIGTLRIAASAAALPRPPGMAWQTFHDLIGILAIAPAVLLLWGLHRGLSTWAQVRAGRPA